MTELEGIQGVVCAGRNRSIIEGIDVLTGIMQQEGYDRIVSEFRKQFPEVDRKGSGDSQLVALDERDSFSMVRWRKGGQDHDKSPRN